MPTKPCKYELGVPQVQNEPFYLVNALFNNDTDKIVLLVYYHKLCYQHFGYHCCLHGDDNDELAKVYLDNYEMDLMLNHEKLFLAEILHEYGHFVTRDQSRVMDDEARKDDRTAMILAGKVALEELMADEFAVRHVGKSTMIAFLDYVIRRRRLRNDPDADVAIAELENRKRAIKRM